MAPQEIKEHLQTALKEIGEIKPWFDREVNEWVFSHPLYPVEYGGDSEKEVIENYPKYLSEFLKHRLLHRLDSLVEKKTNGHGGTRTGAGRPKSARTVSTVNIRLASDMAAWVKEHKEEIYSLMEGDLELVPSK